MDSHSPEARGVIPGKTARGAVAGEPSIGTVPIKVVCRDPADREILRRVRQWSHQLVEPSCDGAIGSVLPVDCVDGLRSPSERTGPVVIVASHSLEDVVLAALEGRDDVETILHVPLVHSRLPYPSACRGQSSARVIPALITVALRKAIIRLRTKAYHIRQLQGAEEFKSYFGLRYRVWREMNYIPANRLSTQTEWELDYSDRLAIPVGAFVADAMVGCARLVMPLGAETATVDLIRELLAARADPVLTANFQYPRILTHPFDLLASFPAFQSYYHDLVVRRVRKAEVSRVIVLREHRHRGIGELLVDNLVSIAGHAQIQRLFLACSETNAPLYQRSAFTILPRMQTDRFVNVNAPAIAMERDLSDLP